jgi:hypothetical protein
MENFPLLGAGNPLRSRQENVARSGVALPPAAAGEAHFPAKDRRTSTLNVWAPFTNPLALKGSNKAGLLICIG